MRNNHLNLLVTGGAGYLGSVIVDRLLDMNCVQKVYMLDNLLYKQQSFLNHFKHFQNVKIFFRCLAYSDKIIAYVRCIFC